MPAEARAPDGHPERRVDEGGVVDTRVDGVLDEHGEQPDQRGVRAQAVVAQRVPQGPVQVPGVRESGPADRPQVVDGVGGAADRQPYARPAGAPEGVREPVEQVPERAMPLAVAERAQPFGVPGGLITVEHDPTVRQMRLVAR
nr:hypothetical protein [Streptomyces scabiei]